MELKVMAGISFQGISVCWYNVLTSHNNKLVCVSMGGQVERWLMGSIMLLLQSETVMYVDWIHGSSSSSPSSGPWGAKHNNTGHNTTTLQKILKHYRKHKNITENTTFEKTQHFTKNNSIENTSKNKATIFQKQILKNKQKTFHTTFWTTQQQNIPHQYFRKRITKQKARLLELIEQKTQQKQKA